MEERGTLTSHVGISKSLTLLIQSNACKNRESLLRLLARLGLSELELGVHSFTWTLTVLNHSMEPRGILQEPGHLLNLWFSDDGQKPNRIPST